MLVVAGPASVAVSGDAVSGDGAALSAVASGGSMHVHYHVAARGVVAIEIFNTAEQRAARLADREQEAGDYQAVIDVRDVPIGVYVVRLRDNRGQRSVKVMIEGQ